MCTKISSLINMHKIVYFESGVTNQLELDK